MTNYNLPMVGAICGASLGGIIYSALLSYSPINNPLVQGLKANDILVGYALMGSFFTAVGAFGVLGLAFGSGLEALVNKIPEKQVVIEKPVTSTVVNDKDVVKEMINDKYYSVYFDFNKATPIEHSTAAIDVILAYLRKNPSASLDIVGHADQVGSSEYNDKLSTLRANNVKTILEKAGISSSRLNVISEGADISIQKDSAEARRLARRVTFKVK